MKHYALAFLLVGGPSGYFAALTVLYLVNNDDGSVSPSGLWLTAIVGTISALVISIIVKRGVHGPGRAADSGGELPGPGTDYSD